MSLIVCLSTSFLLSGQNVDSIPPGKESESIDLAYCLERMIEVSERAETSLSAAQTYYAEADEFLVLLSGTTPDSRDFRRFDSESKQRYRNGDYLAEITLMELDSVMGVYLMAARSLNDQGKVFPSTGKGGKVQRLYRKVLKLRTGLIDRQKSMRAKFQPEEVSIGTKFRNGDTVAVREYYSNPLFSSDAMPSSLGRVTVDTLSGGGMRIKVTFRKSQPLFDLADPDLQDVKALVDTLSYLLKGMLVDSLDLSTIEVSAYLRETEEDLSFIPNAANYQGEFGLEPLIIQYSFHNPDIGTGRERRQLLVEKGTQGFVNATVLKLEGLRRAFGGHGIDRSLIGANIYAPVRQEYQEKFIISLVIH